MLGCELPAGIRWSFMVVREDWSTVEVLEVRSTFSLVWGEWFLIEVLLFVCLVVRVDWSFVIEGLVVR